MPHCSSVISVSSVFHPWLRNSFRSFLPFVCFCPILLRRGSAAQMAQCSVLHHEPIRPNPGKSDQIRPKVFFMTATRKGKIARLPKNIRDELNRRLSDGELGTALVGWLNSLPEVQRIVANEFSGRPVRTQNLSEWKQGGYEEWL